jgi:hypothetical protein
MATIESTGSPVPVVNSSVVRARLRTLYVVARWKLPPNLNVCLFEIHVRLEETSRLALGAVVMGYPPTPPM